MGNPTGLQIGEELGRLRAQQRTDDPSPHGGNSAQPMQAAAPHQMHQHGLQIVLRLMGRGNFRIRGEVL